MILDPATGAVVTTVGPVGFSVTGLAVDPADGVMYGSTGFEVDPAGSLITIDRDTGAGTLSERWPVETPRPTSPS